MSITTQTTRACDEQGCAFYSSLLAVPCSSGLPGLSGFACLHGSPLVALHGGSPGPVQQSGPLPVHLEPSAACGKHK
eukprot:17069-Heterococcus_DN1.PRE.3